MASKDKNQNHPVFKNVVASKRTYAYALLQGKSVWNAEKGYSTRVAPTQIGSIKSKDGIGECVFNINFLSENPEFIPWKVIRVGQGKFEYERRSEAEIKEIKQKLADSQDILDDIKANPSKPGIRTKASVARNSGSATPKTCGTARKFGDYYLLKSFMDKMPSFNILKKIMPDDKYILLVYMIMTCLSKGIKSISYEIEAFVREHALDLDINSYKDHIQRLYKYIDENGVINEFAKFKTQYHKKKNGNKHMQFLALDGTNVDNAGNCLTKAQYGKSKSGTDNKVINFITLVDQSTHELFSTVTYAGNITDVLTVESVCRQLVDRGAGDNISLVCDRGFWSINNISAMLEHNISFVCNCNIAKSKLIKEQVDVISRDLLRDRGLVFSSSADITDTAPKLLAGKTIQLPLLNIAKKI
ncbi:transposase [Anaerobiospirillum thomasii]|uniref:Transposase n=1 Tax=Anaerobiospirillum thomasii TaxID=179995 RepID=A0A2X0V2J5_9GAMM|nr:transposase [Anaerobiospirillum thomasii]SPT68759.1 Transposase [Anaerobiospirillum thomasii]